MSVKQFVNLCAKKLDIPIVWKFKGIKEVGVDKNTKKTIIKIDKKFFRPAEVDFLKGDFSKARKLLKWKPKYNANDLISEMINYEKELYK